MAVQENLTNTKECLRIEFGPRTLSCFVTLLLVVYHQAMLNKEIIRTYEIKLN